VAQQTVPKLETKMIKAIKKAALSASDKAFKAAHSKYRRTNLKSKFNHPGGYMGPLEVAATVSRVTASVEPQSTAKALLISGDNVPPKVYGSWSFQTGTPPGGYSGGPLAMAKVEIDYGAAAGEGQGRGHGGSQARGAGAL
jgi:hypothetical protein